MQLAESGEIKWDGKKSYRLIGWGKCRAQTSAGRIRRRPWRAPGREAQPREARAWPRRSGSDVLSGRGSAARKDLDRRQDLRRVGKAFVPKGRFLDGLNEILNDLDPGDPGIFVGLVQPARDFPFGQRPGHGDAEFVVADKPADQLAEDVIERAIELMRVEVAGDGGDVLMQ